jgi:hypothetical protein
LISHYLICCHPLQGARTHPRSDYVADQHEALSAALPGILNVSGLVERFCVYPAFERIVAKDAA